MIGLRDRQTSMFSVVLDCYYICVSAWGEKTLPMCEHHIHLRTPTLQYLYGLHDKNVPSAFPGVLFLLLIGSFLLLFSPFSASTRHLSRASIVVYRTDDPEYPYSATALLPIVTCGPLGARSSRLWFPNIEPQLLSMSTEELDNTLFPCHHTCPQTRPCLRLRVGGVD